MVDGYTIWSALLLAFAVSVVLCWGIVRHRHRLWLDQPGERSLHSTPVPRLGGVAMFAGMAVGCWIARESLNALLSWQLPVAALLLWLVALWDDWRSLRPLQRLCAQLLAVVLAVWGGGMDIGLAWLGAASPWLTALILLWGINLYNFMDGMDGFAGGMAVIGFTTLALLGALGGQWPFAGGCLLVAVASLAFLCFNFPPARLFMGDSGSTVLGFLMVVASITGWRLGLYPVWAPLLIFAVFWLDATVTLLRRLLRGERVWQAHREHYYQRWVLAGLSHRRVVLTCYAVMLANAVSVLAWQLMGHAYNGAAPVAGWMLFYAVAAIMSERYFRKTGR